MNKYGVMEVTMKWMILCLIVGVLICIPHITCAAYVSEEEIKQAMSDIANAKPSGEGLPSEELIKRYIQPITPAIPTQPTISTPESTEGIASIYAGQAMAPPVQKEERSDRIDRIITRTILGGLLGLLLCIKRVRKWIGI